jgi:hypothetical protein
LDAARGVVVVLLLTLLVGGMTIFLIRGIVPEFVYYSAILIFFIYLALLIASWRRIRLAFAANIPVAIFVTLATFLSPAHMGYLGSGSRIESAIILTGYVLSAALIYLSWTAFRQTSATKRK